MPVVRVGLMSLILAVGLSCSTIFTNQEDCPRGVSLRFIYDYNMEYANAFHSKVHCVSVYVFDEAGNHVMTIGETSDVLRNEDYRMPVVLDPGNYTLLAYGGLACQDRSFDITSYNAKASGSHINDMYVNLKHDDFVSDQSLHHLFYGAADVEVSHEDEFLETDVYMMKNTNNIRVILQQLNGDPLDIEDFTFSIVDDNTLFSYDNSLIPSGLVTYKPWDLGQMSTGTMSPEGEEEDQDIVVAYAEFSTSRLVTSNSPRLIVKRADYESDIINIPLNNYLLLLKSSQYSDMGKQEFLDRESDWTLIFFLDANRLWINTHIVINDWVVRLNHMEY